MSEPATHGAVSSCDPHPPAHHEQKAREALRASLPDRSLASLKTSLVKLDRWHVSYFTRAADSNANALAHQLPNYLKPLCLSCDRIEHVGAGTTYTKPCYKLPFSPLPCPGVGPRCVCVV
jgi:hypothetical protein